MNKSTKFRTALKPIITAFSVLALCCSTLSYAGDDKTKNAIPSKPYFYTGSHTDGALEFDQYIIRDHYGFAVSLALKTAAPKVYRVLQDTKTYMFQQNQIALMKDVLDELKAVNRNLSDRSPISKPEPQHQRFKRLADEMNKYQVHDSGDVVGLVGDVRFDVNKHKEEVLKLYAPKIAEIKSQLEAVARKEELLKLYAQKIAELKSQLEAVANYWNPSNNKGDALARFREVAEAACNHKQPEDNDSNSEDIARLPVGSIEGKKQTALAEIADYYTAQVEKQNALSAKNGITELAMKPKLKAMDDYYIDGNGLKKPKITPPDIKAGDGSLEWVNPPNFNFVSGYALALAQEIFGRQSFKDEIAALIQQEIRKVTPPLNHQSKTSDHDNHIDMVTGGYDFNGSEYVSRAH